MANCPSPDELKRYLDHGPADASNAAVGEHLNGCPACQKRLDDERFPELAASLRAAQFWPAGLGETVTVTPKPERLSETTSTDLPDQIGGYRVVARLGGGGQGELFRVNDPMLARELALKLGRKPLSAGSALERDELVNEARTLASLRHEGLVNVHALGFLEDGRPYVVLDLVLGANLDEHVGSGRVEPRRAAEIVERLARVVEYLHAHGILHLDIKPRNVMIDGHGQPRLIDLGLARLRYAWAAEPELPWGGTPTYVAPEQAQGEVARVGRATDVFGLGGVLFFLLTGRPLYDGANFNEILAQARRGAYDAKALQDVPAPQQLNAICARALALDPASRYSSAGDLAGALKRYREDAPESNRSAVSARWVTFAAATLAASVALGAIWVVGWRLPVGGAPQTGPGAAASAPLAASSGPFTKNADSGVSVPGVPSTPRVLRFEIRNYPKLDGTHYDKGRSGILGRSSFVAREDDDVTVRAELSEPAYAYLIAFRPDGTEELCDPDDEDAAPQRKPEPQYPPPSKSDERYRLSEGAGLYAFVLVVSRQSLPAYRQWKRRIGPMPWAAKLPCEPGVVWRDDGLGLQPLLADDPAETRGKGAKARDSGEPAAKLAGWLRGLPGIDAVTVEAFPVEPAPGP
jgi:serine/threonine protein kinase